ncbi:MAG: hypothetical protein H5T64_07325 [Chloroflexi bacterium]|nr:hypothetical protein [Chloroflexota bacterium]
MDSSVVGTVVRLPTPERPTPSAEAPELSEWGLKWDAGRKAYVTLDNRYGLPAGSEAGIYLDQKYLKDGQEQRGLIGLKAPIIQKLVEQSWTKGERVLPLMFDPRGKEFEIYSFFKKDREERGFFTGLKVPGGTRLIAPFTLKDYSRGNFALKSSGERGWLVDFKLSGMTVYILFKSGRLIADRSESIAPGTVLAEVDRDLFQTWDIVGPGNICQDESTPSGALYPLGIFVVKSKPIFLSQ